MSSGEMKGSKSESLPEVYIYIYIYIYPHVNSGSAMGMYL